MAFRTFLDRTGDEWQAFDVVPREDERRHYDRRSGHQSEQDESVADDRRDEHDRRLTVGGVGLLGSAQGWLVFERGDERRRLSPIPDGWEKCSDLELDAYREVAQPVRIEAPTLAESATRNG